MNHKKLLLSLALILIFYSIPSLGIEYYDNRIVTISSQISLPIGIKIWFNESSGTIEGLTSWNNGENFASLGIGHFVWHPRHTKKASFSGGFPRLIRYMETRGGIEIPKWLRGQNALHCPWKNRKAFLKAKNSKKMIGLRNFLQKTIPIQAEHITRNLQEVLPDLLASTPIEERKFINDKFYEMARTPAGIYALADYLNFKGAGASKSLSNYKNGTGLLHVLKGMKDAPLGLTTHQAFVWSAKNALTKRVIHSSASMRTARWLPGWFKRVETYLEGDPELSRISRIGSAFTRLPTNNIYSLTTKNKVNSTKKLNTHRINRIKSYINSNIATK